MMARWLKACTELEAQAAFYAEGSDDADYKLPEEEEAESNGSDRGAIEESDLEVEVVEVMEDGREVHRLKD